MALHLTCKSPWQHRSSRSRVDLSVVVFLVSEIWRDPVKLMFNLLLWRLLSHLTEKEIVLSAAFFFSSLS